MSPAVEAALIAGSVGVLTLIGTLLAQFYGIRRTSGDTAKTLRQQREHLDATLQEQREQLDATLTQQRDRTLNERFATAADRLGSDRPAVQLAGVHAMAGLADDWPENRQTCVDVLCAYLRLPYDPEPGEDDASADPAAYRGNREVRHTIIRLIGAHLREGAAVSWEGLSFDLTDVVFDGGDFSSARFSGGIVRFNGAEFSGGVVSFSGAEFSGGVVSFTGVEFSGGRVSFRAAKFSGGTVSFLGAEFSGGEVDFGGAKFSGGRVGFSGAKFSGGWVGFTLAKFSGGWVGFNDAKFSSGTVTFSSAEFSHSVLFDDHVSFDGARFSGGMVSFTFAAFSGGKVGFRRVKFSGGKVSFERAGFSGGEVDFGRAVFSGGEVDFRNPDKWSRIPIFDWANTGLPPAGVLLPESTDATPRHEPGSAAAGDDKIAQI